ncbi:MAG TPA: hypothetical protein VJ751_08020 [Pyrinomonadaceae bacterium]|nr:hypothetical protein [Pyrinomonadaceae bacterium]
MTEAAARLRKPVLRPPEKHQLGYNNILLPPDQVVAEDVINDAAKLLKLSPESVQGLMSQSVPMPVARTASREEAELVSARMRDLGLECLTMSDEDLGLAFSENAVKRVRSMMFDDERVTIFQAGAAEVTEAAWADIVLIVPGRLFETRLEIKERTTRKTENEILDTSEFFRDETVIDFYTVSHSSTWRVSASGFDFSCLGREKALVANENIARLQRLIVSKAVNAHVDGSYARIRNLLELAWGTQAETQSSGWRRERPGKLSVGVATTRSNESQFTRYSRLRYLLRSHR